MSKPSFAIDCQGLSKSFVSVKKDPGLMGSVRSFIKPNKVKSQAVDAFDLQVQQGEFVGLLGPNGAGKTTLMKMLTGIIYPSGGEASVLGYSPSQRAIPFRQQIALVMGQKSQLWWDIPAMDSLLLLQRYYQIEENPFKKRLAELTNILQVEKVLHIPMRRLSLGERMKLELMACLLHHPSVVFLDEPTIGLDLVAQQNIRDFLRRYHQEQNTTVLLTSHYMADVEALCHRIVLILGGKKRFDGPIEKFKDLLGKAKVVSFYFEAEVTRDREFFDRFSPKWNKDFSQVELQIEETELRQASGHILTHYPVTDFFTEKLPIERVMNALLSSPELLQDNSL